jgi:hypothetical protein
VLRIAWVGDAFAYAEQYTEHQQQRKAGNEAGNNGRGPPSARVRQAASGRVSVCKGEFRIAIRN